MSLYRIYGDDKQYLNFVIPVKEVLTRLGKAHPFHLDRRPLAYAAVWKDSLQVDFYYGDDNSDKEIPDIIDNNGRLYLSENAYKVLHTLLEPAGEFLPVHYAAGRGYVFNPLKTAESEKAVDEKNVTYDEHGFVSHFMFNEDRLKSTPVFRTQLDTYLGIFCTKNFKDLVEKNKLMGITFGPDLANPVGKAHGVEH